MTDHDWAAIIEWLGKKGYVLHIPATGPAYLTSRTGAFIRNF